MSVGSDRDREGLAWQIGVWDRISEIYLIVGRRRR